MSDNLTQSDSDSDSSTLWPSEPGDDAGMEIAHAQFEPTADAVVVSIVETVAAVTDRDSLEMPPLFESVDTEALEVIVASARDRERLLEVTFVYQECLVTVSSGGDVVVEVPEQ